MPVFNKRGFPLPRCARCSGFDDPGLKALLTYLCIKPLGTLERVCLGSPSLALSYDLVLRLGDTVLLHKALQVLVVWV